MLLHRAVVLAKLEGTYGTEAAPGPSTDAFAAHNLQPINNPANFHPRDNYDRYLSPFSGVVGRRYGTIQFSTYIHGAGVTASRGKMPDYSQLYAACACSTMQKMTTSAKFSPLSAVEGVTNTSVTLYYYLDGLLWKMTGVRGTWRKLLKAGQQGVIEWTMTGKWGGLSDIGLATPTGIDAVVPPALLSAAFTLNGVSDVANEMTIDLGNKIVVHDDWNQATGVDAVRITGREPKLTVNPKLVTVAVHPFYTQFINGSQMPMSIKIGAATANITTITASKVQIEEPPTIEDDEGLARLRLGCRLNRNSDTTGDNEFRVVIT